MASAMAHAHPEDVPACVFFSYPLHPPGKLDQLRDHPLTALHAPLLFVRGTRDAFCEDAQFQAVRARLSSSNVQVRISCAWTRPIDHTHSRCMINVCGRHTGLRLLAWLDGGRYTRWMEGTTL